MAKIGPLPGGFKPPHVGHYKTVLETLKKGLDKIIVYVGKGSSAPSTTKAPRTVISQDLSIEIWKEFVKGDKNIDIRPSKISPVTDVYDFIDNEGQNGDTLIFIKGERDEEDPRFSNVAQYSEESGK